MRIVASFPITLFSFCLLNGFLTAETWANDKIAIDGTAHMSEISVALEKAFQNQNPNLTFVSNYSGSGGGFKKFQRQEIDINRAARKINKREAESLATLNISFLELPIARSQDQTETLYFYVLSDSFNVDHVREFLKFVYSQEGQKLVARHGQTLSQKEITQQRNTLAQLLKSDKIE